ncbi:MAG: hypothetical protein RLO08_19720 [Parvibaculaceae bacterium]
MDRFDTHTIGLESPATKAFAVTPSDVADLPETTRAIYVGVAGDLGLDMKEGGSVVFQNVAAGSVLAVRAHRVKATGTTADGIVGLA